MIPMIPAEICRAALCEAGRPDLARNIGTNRRGQPMRAWTAYYGADANLVARALALAYGARLEPTSEADVAAMLRQEIEPWDYSPRHWSPKHGQWRDYFNPYEWIEVAEQGPSTAVMNHASRLLEMLHRRGICAPCDEIRTVLEDLLP